ncbi:GNAT family N-acetyltransferase [Microbacterium sp. A84]|uniref:GNAT family N-acetyltransferase n=1 Tax=Microbacterium sp. A84 TaxID=3450715 RepID=UPI003F438B9D
MSEILLRPWSGGDLELLRRGNTADMTTHLGGPETEAQVIARHERYLRFWENDEARSFVMVDGADSVGAICYWKTTWHEEDAFEAGWFVVPEAQGRGVASIALVLLIDDARARAEGRRLLTALPDKRNGPSNAVCRKAGFALVGNRFETFRRAELSMNEWIFDLSI